MNIWPWSRIRELKDENYHLNTRLARWESTLSHQLAAMGRQTLGTNRAVGRIIAKLDPEYARSDFDPQRRRESDELSDQIIRKLIAESNASAAHNPPEQG